ncbi:sigma-E processing peptidase SpoIIGA [Marinisporobacter balticus]|uniref:Sporulation sigma-E factor-processing peptidase n=1 Tax=Marinisporobacter balticus TaxID=2018667 RepID=A0A4R2LIW9_9FIRM|nr:sigma-E processing peptidase SpoIIGA [Marinisporobacter balticus]TCO79295.1 stage II sporulation protein GA (sporulation sigma-E factor processing peptidase) [Marinisporobacter balticus]
MFEVYGEYLFIENLLMNWLILHLTAYFSKAQISKYRVWIGAIVGACYAFVIFFPALAFMYTFLMKVVISILIVLITFTPYKFMDFLKKLAIFYLMSFMFGGAAFALFYLTDFNGLLSNGIFYIGNFSIKLLIYSGIVAYILIRFCWEYIQVKISRDKIYMPIWIEVENHRSKLNALLDTGNSLLDPLSKYPVIIVEYTAIKELLPTDVQSVFDQSQDINLDLISKILQTSKWINRFRIIPFKSLGKENGMLMGFKPDSVKLEDANDLKCIKNIIIGIYTKKLSQNGDYTALLHPDILK